jgi:hypothetical protein
MRVADDVRTRAAVACLLVWLGWFWMTPMVSSGTHYLLRRSLVSFAMEFVLCAVGLVSAAAAFDTDEPVAKWVNGACLVFFACVTCYWLLYLLDAVNPP